MFIEQRIAALEQTVAQLQAELKKLTQPKAITPPEDPFGFILDPTDNVGTHKRPAGNLMLYDEATNRHIFRTVSDEKLLEITELLAKSKNPSRTMRQLIHLAT